MDFNGIFKSCITSFTGTYVLCTPQVSVVYFFFNKYIQQFISIN